MACLAWLNDQARYSDKIELAVTYIVSLIQLGQYGTTQATILSLKAITKYMNNFSAINGDGLFTLTVNGVVAQQIGFTPEDKSAITFDISDFMADPNNAEMFAPGSTLIFGLAIENYTQLLNETITNEFSDDQSLGFKLSYSMNVDYYDVAPPSGNTSISFKIDNLNNDTLLGAIENLGSIFSYDLTIANTKFF